MTARETVNGFNTKHKEGFTSSEMLQVCNKANVDYDEFLEKLGVNTCIMIDNEIITYHSDVELALACCIEGREPNVFEWD